MVHFSIAALAVAAAFLPLPAQAAKTEFISRSDVVE